MTPRQASPTWLLLLLSAAISLALLSVYMLGPLLVSLADEFHTSVPVIGQLAAATAITWGLTAPLAGPVSDTYGRRLMLLIGLMLMALGMLGSVLAWNYDSLLISRLLTGVGGGLVPPNSFAIIADVFPSAERGKAIGWLVSAAGVGAALGVPLVAFLVGTGGWRLPFSVAGVALVGLWICLWMWLPRAQLRPDQSLAFFSHYRQVGSNVMFWYVLATNALQQMASFGVIGYLAAHLMQTYKMQAGDTVLPLALAGAGGVVSGFLGGRVANHRSRLTLLAMGCLGSGLLAALLFTLHLSPWATVVMAFGAASLRITVAVTPTLLLELATNSRTTATGLFAVSNQIGTLGGASLGGLMLVLGGFPLVGLFCLGVSIVAAVLIRLTLRDSARFAGQIALR